MVPNLRTRARLISNDVNVYVVSDDLQNEGRKGEENECNKFYFPPLTTPWWIYFLLTAYINKSGIEKNTIMTIGY